MALLETAAVNAVAAWSKEAWQCEGAGNFGAVTSARQARVMQVSLKVEF